MKKILLFLSVIIFRFAFCQVTLDESKNFIVLENDSVVYGEEIEYFPNQVFSGCYLLLDSVKYETSNVRFFKNNEGTYGFVSTYYYVKRSVKGKVNLYESEMKSYAVPTGYNRASTVSPTILGASKTNYYNKGYEALKIANYDNLAEDLKDNEESMKLLGEYKKNQRKQYVFLGIGIASSVTAVASFIVWNSKNETTFGETPKVPLIPYVFMGVGIGFDIVSFVFGSKKSKYLKASIESYNGF